MAFARIKTFRVYGLGIRQAETPKPVLKGLTYLSEAIQAGLQLSLPSLPP